jgi:F-type H+-transporting ATPase subunit beta
MGKFWVYENWTVKKALLHREDCGACKRGLGMWGGGKTPNGQWHGPYASLELAMNAPVRPQRHVRNCGLCMR